MTKPGEAVNLRRVLGLRHVITTNVGLIIGGAIFIMPTGVIRETKSGGLALVVWLAASAFAVMNGLMYIELAYYVPKCGAIYAYMCRMYPPFVSFVYLWTQFIMRGLWNTVKCLICSEYLLSIFFSDCDSSIATNRLVATLLLCFIVYINCVNVRWTANTHGWVVLCTVSTLILISGIGLAWIAQGKIGDNLDNLFEGSNTRPDRVILALFAGYLTFSGMSAMNNMIEELKNPKRNLLLGFFLSVSIAAVLYFFTNLAYVSVLGKDEMLKTDTIAVAFSRVTLGGIFPKLMSACVVITNAGSLSVAVMIGARSVFDGGRQEQLPRLFSLINVNHYTPVISLVFQLIITLPFLLFLDVYTVIRYAAFCGSVTEAFVIAGLLRLRYKEPQLKSPIKVPIIIIISQLIGMLAFIFIPLVYQPYVTFIGALVCYLPPAILYFLLRLWTPKPTWLREAEDTTLKFFQKLFLALPTWDIETLKQDG